MCNNSLPISCTLSSILRLVCTSALVLMPMVYNYLTTLSKNFLDTKAIYKMLFSRKSVVSVSVFNQGKPSFYSLGEISKDKEVDYVC